MTVLRVRKKETNFLVLDKTCLTERNLSWGAKGLHSYLMSLPPEWSINVYDLKNRATNGRDSVRGLLSELEKAGYIVKEQVRDEVTGKFSCLEYIIHEIPQAVPDELPAPGNPSPDNPGTDYPCPANPTLININNNKYTEQKIIKAAAREDSFLALDEDETKKAAAAFPEKKTKALENKSPSELSFINQAFPEDSVIGKTLTPYQCERLESLVDAIGNQGFFVSAEEIEYCLLNSQTFKGSGQEFGRKLNAIRTVILRGEWQAPAGMVLEAKGKVDANLRIQQAQLHTAHAEVNHFQRLLESATGPVRENLETILTSLQKKMREIEGSLGETIL